jgi:hypothetical protein
MPLRVLSVLLMIAAGAISQMVLAGELPSSTGKVVSPAPPDTSKIDHKLDAIQLTEIEFQQVPLREAVGRVHQAAAKAVKGETLGVNMVIKLGTDDALAPLVTVSLKEGSLRQTLTALAAAAKMKIVVLPYAVGFVAADEFTDPLVTKEYASPGSRFVPPGSTKNVGVRDLLESHGVAFPPGAYAYVTKDGKLVVRNSEANLRVVDEFLDRR